MFKKASKHFFPEDKKALLLIIIGTIAWSLVMVKSGLIYSFGMGFWGANGHDGVWHIALINSLARGSLEMPVFSGEVLKNYHLGFDLLAAVFYRLTRIPVRIIYFQIFPPIFAFLIGLLTFKFVYQWKKSKNAAFWSVFFVYFGGSFGWIVTLLRDGKIAGESMFWSQQSISTLVNPPFALSLVFLLIGLIFLNKLIKKYSLKLLILDSIIFALILPIKVYGGLLVLGALLVSSLFRWARDRKIDVLKVFVLSLVISLLLFFSFDKPVGDLIIFKPFWFLETMMKFEDRVGWQRYYSAMTNYRLGKQWLKGITAYIIAFLIFWYGNMGTRLIQSIGIVKWIKKGSISFWKVFLLLIIFAGVSIPMLFVQSGVAWNTIQFFYYSLMFSGILAGISLAEIIEGYPSYRKIIFGTIILLTLPTTIGTLRDYLTIVPTAKISRNELDALRFLRGQKEGIVLTLPYNRTSLRVGRKMFPVPLYLYESTAYVSAFSQKPTFLEEEVNLGTMRYDYQGRRKEVIEFFKDEGEDDNKDLELLSKNNIKYIYLVGDNGKGVNIAKKLKLQSIFENNEVVILKTDF